MSENEFMKQFAGSGAANVLTAVLFFGVWFVKNKCKHCKMKSHSYCCDLEVNDESEEPSRDLELGERTVSGIIKETVQKMHKRHTKNLPAERPSPVPLTF